MSQYNNFYLTSEIKTSTKTIILSSCRKCPWALVWDDERKRKMWFRGIARSPDRRTIIGEGNKNIKIFAAHCTSEDMVRRIMFPSATCMDITVHLLSIRFITIRYFFSQWFRFNCEYLCQIFFHSPNVRGILKCCIRPTLITCLLPGGL